MKIKSLVAVAAVTAALSGCAVVQAPVSNALITDVRGPVAVGDGAASNLKTGESCAQNILGIYAGGDASISAASRDGGISKVAVVDHHSTGVLWLYARYCTVVRGE